MSILKARHHRELGWTKRMMVRFLVKLDGFAQHLQILTGRPKSLKRTDRVQDVESHDDFTGYLFATKIYNTRFADL